jgi:hypothetical protein
MCQCRVHDICVFVVVGLLFLSLDLLIPNNLVYTYKWREATPCVFKACEMIYLYNTLQVAI